MAAWSVVRKAGLIATAIPALYLASCTTRWVAYQAPDGSFSVRFPRESPSIRQMGPGEARRTDYSVSEGANTFMIQVFEGSQYRREDAATLLQDYPNPRGAGVDGRVVSSSSLQLAGYPGRAVRIEGAVKDGSVVLIERAYVGSGRMFVATVAAAPGRKLSRDAEAFLDSFKILR
jgi:hypothetical protein